MDAISQKLFSAVLNYLDITWDDAGTMQKIQGITTRGIAYLNQYAGAELNFMDEGNARALLLDYCRYARSNALEMFEKNYLSELMALRIETQVKEREDQDEP